MSWDLKDDSATFKVYESDEFIGIDGNNASITIDTFEKKVRLNIFNTIDSNSTIEFGEFDIDMLFIQLFTEDDDFNDKCFKLATHICKLLELPTNEDCQDINSI